MILGPQAWGGASPHNPSAAGRPDPRWSDRENECGGCRRRMQEADAGGGCRRRRRRKERRGDAGASIFTTRTQPHDGWE